MSVSRRRRAPTSPGEILREEFLVPLSMTQPRTRASEAGSQSELGPGRSTAPLRSQVAKMAQLGFRVVVLEPDAHAPVPQPVAQRRPVAVVLAEDQQQEPLIPGRETDAIGRAPRIETASRPRCAGLPCGHPHQPE